MKAYRKIFFGVIGCILAIFLGANLMLLSWDGSQNGGFFSGGIGGYSDSQGRPYRVEISRIAREIEANGLECVDLDKYENVTHVEKYGVDDQGNSDIYDEENSGVNDEGSNEYSRNFYYVDSDYVIREINGELYRFDYIAGMQTDKSGIILIVNLILGGMSLVMIGLLLFVRQKILLPFERLTEVPYELSKGNLTVPIKENKSRFFGKFIWGVDLLRENMEQQKQRELDLQRDRKTLLLSLSHDIKTPLSAIKLYAKALSRGLYSEKEKQIEIAENINTKANEIADYVSQIIASSREDVLSHEVIMSEFYLSELVSNIRNYYSEKLKLIKTDFVIEEFMDCMLKGDLDRSVEVLQNVMENAIKYGDGNDIRICISEEEGCILVSVRNSGCQLPDVELPHIFDSFWRGSNAGNTKGSGLGLYICRQLMHKMNGEIFAEIRDGKMCVTAVFGKA